MPDTLPLPENRRAVSWHWIVLGLLVVVHAGVGAWLNPFGKTVSESGITGEVLIGFLLSQPLLLAFWAAFAPQRFYHRFLWSLLLCILVSFIEEIGALRHQKDGIGRGMLLGLTLFVIATMLLLFFHRFSRWQFKQSPAEELPSDYQPHQFGIKHILILTTIAALACGLVRTLLIMNPSLKWLPSIAEYLGILCIVLALLFPVLIIPWYTLAFRGRIATLILFTVIIAGICDLSVYFMVIATIPSPATDEYEQIIKPFFLFQLGAALSFFITTLVIRFCGFRMIRMPKEAAAAVVP